MPQGTRELPKILFPILACVHLYFFKERVTAFIRILEKDLDGTDLFLK